ncbi:hypothetical protein [Lentzea atacamensis]|uniref:hypothetical protein n=1 Tax=Lentzea atacamensis TaxID=531938 RepID=UPI000DD35A20|nr:hypothetical protein [Lentzea atacamensis]
MDGVALPFTARLHHRGHVLEQPVGQLFAERPHRTGLILTSEADNRRLGFDGQGFMTSATTATCSIDSAHRVPQHVQQILVTQLSRGTTPIQARDSASRNVREPGFRHLVDDAAQQLVGGEESGVAHAF